MRFQHRHPSGHLDFAEPRCKWAGAGSANGIRGVGLIEALLVIGLMVALGAAVLPEVREAINLRRLHAASAQWATLVQAARHWAFTLNRPVRLEFQAEPSPCLLLHTGPRGACSGCHAAPCREGAQLLGLTPKLGSEIAASASSTSLFWNPPDRTVTPTGTLRLELADGRALHQVVNLAGRMRLCSPGGLVGGVPPC